MATYYDALNRVHRLFRERQLPAAPQLVMLHILHEHNRVGNVGQVELSDRELISITGYSKSTITDSKRRLKSLGLIDWKTTRRERTIYNFPFLESRQLQGQSAGHKVGQTQGQASRFSVPSNSSKVEDKKTQDAPAREQEAESSCDWLYVKFANLGKEQ